MELPPPLTHTHTFLGVRKKLKWNNEIETENEVIDKLDYASIIYNCLLTAGLLTVVKYTIVYQL